MCAHFFHLNFIQCLQNVSPASVFASVWCVDVGRKVLTFGNCQNFAADCLWMPKNSKSLKTKSFSHDFFHLRQRKITQCKGAFIHRWVKMKDKEKVVVTSCILYSWSFIKSTLNVDSNVL